MEEALGSGKRHWSFGDSVSGDSCGTSLNRGAGLGRIVVSYGLSGDDAVARVKSIRGKTVAHKGKHHLCMEGTMSSKS